MDALIFVLYMAVFLAALGLFFALVLWPVPVRIATRFVLDRDQKNFVISAGWGPVSIVRTLREGQATTQIRILNHPVATLSKGETTEGDRETLQNASAEHIHTAPDLIPVIRNFASPAAAILRLLYSEGRFSQCMGIVRIGLGDPAATGLFYGSYWATRFLFTDAGIDIRMEPVFDRSVLELDLVAEYRIRHPLYILVRAVRELLRPGVFSGIRALNAETGARGI